MEEQPPKTVGTEISARDAARPECGTSAVKRLQGGTNLRRPTPIHGIYKDLSSTQGKILLKNNRHSTLRYKRMKIKIPVDTYPDPRSANETEANEDSNSQEPVDTYSDPGSANEAEANKDSNSYKEPSTKSSPSQWTRQQFIPDPGNTNEMTEANVDSNSNSKAAVNTYPGNATETTEAIEDSNSNSEAAVDTYPSKC